MSESRFFLALEFRDDPLRQLLAQFDAPRVERVHAPNRARRKNIVLVEGDELTEGFRVRLSAKIVFDGRLPSKTRWGTSRSGVPSAWTRSAVFPKRQENVVVPAKRVERLAKGDEVTWDEPRSMMDHLVKAVLAIGPRLANIHGAVSQSTLEPSSVTYLPLLSIVNRLAAYNNTISL